MSRHLSTERVSEWVSGDMNERDAAVARAHVAACADCARVADSLGAEIAALRTLERPEPPPTLWLAIEGAVEADERRRLWSWRPLALGALAGAVAVAVVAWGVARGGGAGAGRSGAVARAEAGAGARPAGGGAITAHGPADLDPLLAEAEGELDRAATSYAEAAARLRKILNREQALWDPEARARVAERLARLDEAIVHSRAVADSDPGDGAGAEMLFSAYRRQIDFLAEAVHRGSPGPDDGWR